ncbi:MAG: hypothetical protein KDA25_04795, partial [Phycisphaerales bacterium]|nr:hypothetical protein [Phycisphaerales bacterium]
LLLPHLLVQAAMCGGATLLPLAPGSAGLRITVILGAVGHFVFSLLETSRPHPTENGRQGAAFLSTLRLGPLRLFREGMLIGVVAAIPLVFVAPILVPAVVLGGLFLYEHAFVRAGQLPPLS